eukprot:m.12055 g.12055  ORF g.12055 m.12055 type:complete len:319 (+) comp5939_c0_seq1:45-1001(+)
MDSIAGVPIKYISLFVLVIQNSAYILTLRASRIQPGEMYIPTTAVVLSEVLKMIGSIFLVFIQERGIVAGLKHMQREIFDKPRTTAKLLVPAGLYTFQNTLIVLAVGLLDAATFQLTYQLKVLTTALFSVFLLGKRLSKWQWMALVLLTLGIALIQMPSNTSAKETDDSESSVFAQFAGLLMVITACFSSGFAGVYFEKMLKGETSGIWIMNIVLGAYGTLLGTAALAWSDGAVVRERGFFVGYTNYAVAGVLLQAFGGLVVAVVVKYADNILKGFATSISIIISCIVSIQLFGFVVTSMFALGALMVIGATFLYSYV